MALISSSSAVKTYCQRWMVSRHVSFFKRGGKSADEQQDLALQDDQTDSQPEYVELVPKALPKSYSPPEKVEKRILSIAQEFTQEEIGAKTQMRDKFFKYRVLEACIKAFNFDIPNSQLGDLKTISDVINYYSEARNPLTPEEKLKNSDLPGNVNLQFDPVRFTEDTKDLFGGKTAFPERDTLVTSLKYRNIYKGYTNEKVYQKKDGFHYF